MEQDYADAFLQAFASEDTLWKQVPLEEEADDELHRECASATALVMDDDAQDTSVMHATGNQGTGTPQLKSNLEAKSADRLNNNQELFQEVEVPRTQALLTLEVELETEAERLFDLNGANMFGCQVQQEHPAAQNDVSDNNEVFDLEDESLGSADETRESLSDRSDSPEDLQDIRVDLLEEEDLDIDDQGIYIDDQVSDYASDEDHDEGNEVDNSITSTNNQESRENDIFHYGGEAAAHARLLEEFGLQYKKDCLVPTGNEQPESMSSSGQDSESEMPSSEMRGQHVNMPSNCDSSEVFTAAAMEEGAPSDLQQISPTCAERKLLSSREAENSITCTQGGGDKTDTKTFVLNNGSAARNSLQLDQHPQQEYISYSSKETFGFGATVGLIGTSEPVGTIAFEELVEGPVVSQKESSKYVLSQEIESFPACSETGMLKYEETQQDDLTGAHLRKLREIPITQGPVDLAVVELDVEESDESDVHSQNSQEDAQHAISETEEDLDLEEDQTQPADIMEGERLVRSKRMCCSPGARHVEYHTEDSYDSVDDKIETREFKGDRGRDISDKLDPEILHLLELHLLKQQLVVIEEEEEEEEESDFDGFHVNAHKLHFENFGPSRKMGHLLDMVLEEPELLEEKELEEDDLTEVQLEDSGTMNHDLDKEIDPFVVGLNGASLVDSESAGSEDVDITATFADLVQEESVDVLQIKLHQGVGTELSSEEDTTCSTEASQIHRDTDQEVQSFPAISGHLDRHTGHSYEQEIVHVPPGFSLLNTLPNTDQFLQLNRPSSETLEQDSRFSGQVMEDTNSAALMETEIPFHCIQITAEMETSTCVRHALCHEVNMCDSLGTVTITSHDRCKTTETESIVLFDDVTKHCGQRELTSTPESREQTLKNTGWLVEVAGDKPQLVNSALTADCMNPVHSCRPAAMAPTCAESPYGQERDITLLQQNVNGPTSRTCPSDELEAEEQQTCFEKESVTAVPEDVTRHVERKEMDALLRGRPLEPSKNCNVQNIPTPSCVAHPYSEKGPDLYQQLAEALDWAQASERRNSELHVELDVLRSRCESLCREKAELLTVLSEREAELHSFQLQRESRRLSRDQEAAMDEPPRVQNETELPQMGTPLEASTNRGEEHCTANKAQNRPTAVQQELDFFSQEARAVVEQLTSLQEDLRDRRQLRKPSSFLHHLLRTGLVASLGILLFWWGTKQLG